ncbi:hypothetical protein [Aestuariivivens sediminicola]|uniref:hypothetical protein n=1 Tax=Aestuariivivens sediminicola TaxID=2913560 RepID=UPI001F5685D6|nr:hypothetical protein [Aestuariivivens sediminicola]
MKQMLKFPVVFILIIGIFISSSGTSSVYAQKAKKNTVRLKVDYIKIMDSMSYFNIKAFSRVNRENVDVSDIDLTVYNELDDENVELGSTTTDRNGECKFVLKNFNTIASDSTGTYNFVVKFKGDDTYKKASKSVSFKDASIETNLTTKDSINYLSAVLKETKTDSVLSDQLLNVQVQRLFRPLKIGKEFNITDENGSVIVSIDNDIPGINGNLMIEVVLSDSESYGTVKALVKAPFGTPIVEESTFDKRTMWSPRNKTPLFLLIFPNLIIFGIWGFIIYLFYNLFKISKS